MRFAYSLENGESLFTAITENDEELSGFRAQGPYAPLKLVEKTLRIGYVSKKPLHPDIIAAICVTAFYPFIKGSVAFPMHVSSHFASALTMKVLPSYEMINGAYKPASDIYVRGVDPTLEPYKGGDKTVCVYGGGCDSTAIALMFPEFPLIHLVKDKTVGRVKEFVERNLKNPYHEIQVNCWDLTKPCGFTAWTNITLGALIMAQDLEIKHITMGSVLESATLANGAKYTGMFKSKYPNRWRLFYEHVGLNLFSVIGGVSEILTSKVVVDAKLADYPLFCELDKGGICYKCIKCMRKLLQYEYWGGPAMDEELWKGFNADKFCDVLNKRPLEYANILIEVFKRCKVPTVYKQCLYTNLILDSSTFRKVYPLSFTAFPEEIREMLVSRITSHLEVMNEYEVSILQRWELKPEVKSIDKWQIRN